MEFGKRSSFLNAAGSGRKTWPLSSKAISTGARGFASINGAGGTNIRRTGAVFRVYALDKIDRLIAEKHLKVDARQALL